MSHRTASDEGLCDLVHADCGLESRRYPERLQRILKRKTIDDRGKHSHVIAGHLVDAHALCLHTTIDVSATEDNAHLYAKVASFLNVLCERAQSIGIDAILLLTHERFAAKLEQDALVERSHGCLSMVVRNELDLIAKIVAYEGNNLHIATRKLADLCNDV